MNGVGGGSTGPGQVEAFRMAVQLAVADWLRQIRPTMGLDRNQIETVVERAIATWIGTDVGRRLLSDAVRSGVEQTAHTWLCQNGDAVVRAVREGRRRTVSPDIQ
jgi:hypothetical protein